MRGDFNELGHIPPRRLKAEPLPFQEFNALRTVDTRAPFLEAGQQIHVRTLTRTGNRSQVTTRPPPRRDDNVKRRAATCVSTLFTVSIDRNPGEE